MPLEEDGWVANVGAGAAIIRDDFLFSEAHLSSPLMVNESFPITSTLRSLYGLDGFTAVGLDASALAHVSNRGGLADSSGLRNGYADTSPRVSAHAGNCGSQRLVVTNQSEVTPTSVGTSPCSSSFLSPANSNSASPPELITSTYELLQDSGNEGKRGGLAATEHGAVSLDTLIPTFNLANTATLNHGLLANMRNGRPPVFSIKEENYSLECEDMATAHQQDEFDAPAETMETTIPPSESDSFEEDETGMESHFILSPSPHGHQLPHPPTKVRSKMHDLALAHRLISNQNTRGQGLLYLSAEEKRTLVQEGYSLPTRLPLTREEEEALKIVRRKIKNKLSAQESRRKRKEYMDSLERKAHTYYNDNLQLRQRVKELELVNYDLYLEIKRIQHGRPSGYSGKAGGEAIDE